MRPMIHRNAWLPTVFNSLFDADLMPRTAATAPAINVLESDKDYTVELAAPGLKKEDFNVNINDEGNLVIKMEQKQENKEEDKKGHYLRRPTMWRRIQFQLVWRTACSPSSCPRCSRPSRKRVARLR